MDTPSKAPPLPSEGIEPLAPQRPPDAHEQILAPKQMAASSSGFQPRAEAAYPDSLGDPIAGVRPAMRMAGTTARMPDRMYPCDLR
eukprot:1427710-Pleurochrysis_carterae.AAC.1